ncbi:MAG TPA: tetratricopeptide repeat protein [Pirellulales bacterium]|nr:tetratricopeptide repeat protein [Pirellulales bacterium]
MRQSTPRGFNLSNDPASQNASSWHTQMRSQGRRRLQIMGGICLIAGSTLLVYWPSIHGGFLLDDDVLLTQNKLIKAPDGWAKMWTTHAVDFWPISHGSLWLEWRLWEMNPTGYHATNLLLHVVDSLLVWFVLTQLELPGAFLAALLFAVHPVNVDAVAWIAQRKSVLALLFFLLSISSWLKAEQTRGAHGNERASSGESFRATLWYGVSLLMFLLAMLSKGSVAILPAVLLLMVWWQRGHITRWDLLRSLPYWLVSAVLVPINIWFQTHGTNPIRHLDLEERLAGAGCAVWFYLLKALAPIGLSFMYPMWNVQTNEVRWWLPTGAAVALTAVLLWWRETRWGRPLLMAWMFFCIALLPALGLTDVGFMKYAPVADRYQQLAMLGILALVAACWRNLYDLAVGSAHFALLIPVAVIVPTMMWLTWNHSREYSDIVPLYSGVLENNPECPNDPEALNNRGAMLALTGHPDQAIEFYERALALTPGYGRAQDNYGRALMELNRPQQAIGHFEVALNSDPDDPEIHYDLGVAFSNVGQPQEALAQYQAALQLKPDYADACANAATALAQLQRSTEAVETAQQALNMAQSQGNADLVQRIQAWLDSYRASLHTQ